MGRWVWGAALVVVLAGCTAPSAGPEYVGPRWTLAAVDHQGRHVAVPDGGYAEFARDGRFTMGDTVHVSSGAYAATRAGLEISGAAISANGWVGTDPARRLAIEAVGAVLGSGGRSRVGAHVVDGDLVLTAGPYVLGFRRAPG